MRYHHVRFSGIKVNDQWQTYGTLHIWKMEAHGCTFGTQTKIERKEEQTRRLLRFDCTSDDTLTPTDPVSDVYSHLSVVLNYCFLTPGVFVERMWWVQLYEVLFSPMFPLFRVLLISFFNSFEPNVCVCLLLHVCLLQTLCKNVPRYQSNTVEAPLLISFIWWLRVCPWGYCITLPGHCVN